MKKISFEQAAEELHAIIRESDGDTIAALYEYAFGAVKSCDRSVEEDILIVIYHPGLEE